MNFLDDILALLGLISPNALLPLPAPLPVAWMGIDRRDFPKKAGNANTDWMTLMIENSNLRFSGAYLEGKSFPPSSTAGQFTTSTKTVSRDWVPNVPTLRDMGWGIAFWYVGYSVGGGQPLPSTTALPLADYAARGVLHAQHAKMIVSSISPSLENAVVFFDNEDIAGTSAAALSKLDSYYGAFFDELQKPGPGSALALRPGIYAHSPVAKHFLSDRPYVFVWEVTLDTATTTTPVAPFSKNDNPLVVTPTAKRALNPFRVSRASQTWVGWSVGRQFRYYTGAMPIGGSAIANAVSGLIPYSLWDYDSSVVRDPSYPSGNPRLAVGVRPGTSPGSTDPIVARGDFVPRPVNPQVETVDLLTPSGHSSVALTPPQCLEPDSPIAAAIYLGEHQTGFASFLVGGEVAVFDTSGLAWVSTGSAGPVDARRLRALAYVLFSATDQQIFFVGHDSTIAPHCAIYGLRQSGGVWGAPQLMGGTLRVHPSAMLAATTRAGTSVDVFSFNENGLLTTTWWVPSSPTWPASNSQILESAPGAFLPMGALAAVSAAANKLHVFGIGKDLRLRYLEFTNTAWGSVQVLGAATDLVFPHTRIAVQLRSATRIEVAVMSDRGSVRLHALESSGGVWKETLPPTVFDPPPAAAKAGYTPPGPSAITEIAYGWSLNPYGDLGLNVVSGDTTIFAAGLSLGDTAVLRRSVASGNEWERYR